MITNKIKLYIFSSLFYILKKIFRIKLSSEIYSKIYYKPYWSILYATIDNFNLDGIKNYTFKRIDLEKILFEKYNIVPEVFFDPFYFYETKKKKEYIFFEISYFDLKLKKYKSGDIFYLIKNPDEQNWNFGERIISTETKISFPQIISFKENIYMIPETSAENEVSLHKSFVDDFPNRWKKEKILLSGKDFQDPVFFEKDNIYYLFVSTNKDSLLRIYFSDNFINKEFTEHPLSPIYKSECTARAAGKFIKIENKLIRPAQYKFHGNQILFFEIKKLSKTEFEEEIYYKLEKLENNNYANKGVHHIDINKIDNHYIILVDGYFLKPHFYHNTKK
jgi:hypothetical protein